MSERIAVTPPDRDGQQVFWNRTETEGGGALFLPEDPDEAAAKLLVPENYKHEVGQDENCIGVGSIGDHEEAGFVHARHGFAIKSAPFQTQERMLGWLAANLMMHQAILSLAEEGQDYIRREVQSPHENQIYKIKTPQYFGVLALEVSSGRAIIVMSDESIPDGRALSQGIFARMDASLLGITMRTMENLYPESYIRWDPQRTNWIIRPNEQVLVRIDLFGNNPNDHILKTESWV